MIATHSTNTLPDKKAVSLIWKYSTPVILFASHCIQSLESKCPGTISGIPPSLSSQVFLYCN